MQVAEDGFDVQNDLAVERDPKPEHPVRAGVLRSQVYRDWLGL